MIAKSAFAALALSLVAITSASAGTVIKKQVVSIDGFGNRISKTRVVATNDFGDRVARTSISRTDPFGNTVRITRVSRSDSFGGFGGGVTGFGFRRAGF